MEISLSVEYQFFDISSAYFPMSTTLSNIECDLYIVQYTESLILERCMIKHLICERVNRIFIDSSSGVENLVAPDATKIINKCRVTKHVELPKAEKVKMPDYSANNKLFLPMAKTIKLPYLSIRCGFDFSSVIRLDIRYSSGIKSIVSNTLFELLADDSDLEYVDVPNADMVSVEGCYLKYFNAPNLVELHCSESNFNKRMYFPRLEILGCEIYHLEYIEAPFLKKVIFSENSDDEDELKNFIDENESLHDIEVHGNKNGLIKEGLRRQVKSARNI